MRLERLFQPEVEEEGGSLECLEKEEKKKRTRAR